MNPASRQKLISILFVIFSICCAIFCFYMANETEESSYKWIGFLFLIFLIFYFYKFFQIELPETTVEFNEGVEAYKKYLEKNLKLTIPQDYLVEFTNHTKEWYRTALKVPDTIKGGFMYYPIEINKKWQIGETGDKFIQFGEGQGEVTKSVDRVNTFKLKGVNQPFNSNNELLEKLIEKKLSEVKQE